VSNGLNHPVVLAFGKTGNVPVGSVQAPFFLQRGEVRITGKTHVITLYTFYRSPSEIHWLTGSGNEQRHHIGRGKQHRRGNLFFFANLPAFRIKRDPLERSKGLLFASHL